MGDKQDFLSQRGKRDNQGIALVTKLEPKVISIKVLKSVKNSRGKCHDLDSLLLLL